MTQRNKYKQRGIRNGEVSKCKQQALNDMPKELRKYIKQEYKILQLKKYDLICYLH